MKRIALFIPNASSLAESLLIKSAQENREIEIVLAHLETDAYSEELPKGITTRPYQWKSVSKNIADIALTYANSAQELPANNYQIPDDGINYFSDCSLLLIAADSLKQPLLPLLPHVIMNTDSHIDHCWNIIRDSL